MNVPSTPTAKTRTRRVTGSQIWLGLLAAVMIGLVLFFVVRIGGYVECEEFSPALFRTREFSFYEIPLIHWQITPIRRDSSTPEAARYLTQNKLVLVDQNAPDLWHLVSVSTAGGRQVDDDAALLVRQLRFFHEGEPTWKKWSKDHPELAKVLWPTVAKLSRRELYLLVPRLLEIVRDIDQPVALRQAMDDYLSEEYASLIADMRAAGRDALAEELTAEAREDGWITLQPAET